MTYPEHGEPALRRPFGRPTYPSNPAPLAELTCAIWERFQHREELGITGFSQRATLRSSRKPPGPRGKVVKAERH